MSDELKPVQFENKAPEDKEWSAHIELLKEWTPCDRQLRSIIQYARSGEFYPADMHVDLIEQYFYAKYKRIRQAVKNRKGYGTVMDAMDAAAKKEGLL